MVPSTKELTLSNRLQAHLGRGDYLAAASLGLQSVEDDPRKADPELLWLTGLALARCGATETSEELLRSGAITRRLPVSSPLRVDVDGLLARLSKDRALQSATSSERNELASRSARQYEAMAKEYASFYASVNAATMYLFCGEVARGKELAATTIELVEKSTDAREGYWRLVSQAEALLILGDDEGAADHLAAAAREEADWSMIATTRRQLQMVCDLTGFNQNLIQHLRLPTLLHYSGHMFSSGPEDVLAAEVDDQLKRLKVGAAYGALACGSDIIIAERVLAADLELHVCLPCSSAQFVANSVEPAGHQWVDRFHQALGAARSVSTEPATLVDDAMYRYGDQLAMGQALLRARQLGCEVAQLAVWDEQLRPNAGAGTATAVGTWHDTGGQTTVLPFDRGQFSSIPTTTGETPNEQPGRTRSIRAVLFVDITGFSKLEEPQLPQFFEEVMAALARALEPFSNRILHRNTWGDAIHLVLADSATAAACALAIQQSLRDLQRQSQWTGLSARIGGHAGPIYSGFDHVLGTPTFFGTHITRAARIEPRTPPGEIFFTAALAALLALEPSNHNRLEYVGEIQVAKGYGTFPMFLLRDG